MTMPAEVSGPQRASVERRTGRVDPLQPVRGPNEQLIEALTVLHLVGMAMLALAPVRAADRDRRPPEQGRVDLRECGCGGHDRFLSMSEPRP
jgi:hypothetical protein